jgi:hypothetical protein
MRQVPKRLLKRLTHPEVGRKGQTGDRFGQAQILRHATHSV